MQTDGPDFVDWADLTINGAWQVLLTTLARRLADGTLGYIGKGTVEGVDTDRQSQIHCHTQSLTG